ncbi:MAG TPA: ribosome silencing factor [Thiotrichaceae bacterium]|jgi:ribosome-associated protein|nr:ribosome silencing factor [Thiotrichaceae bacterium]HIM07533.1 ribosome silencing factor [Gammaproteobacteria bacterium]
MKKTKELLDITLAALEDVKAVDVVVFEVSKLTSISDYMVIASGRSKRQVGALAESVVEAAKTYGTQPLGVEGKTEGEWVLVDLGDIIVHIMYPDTREYYQLEKLWSSADDRKEDQKENVKVS